MENISKNETWKGIEFWTEEIKKVGLYEKLKFFNDVVTEKRPPNSESGYGEPVLKDIILDGKKVDIYHTDNTDKDHWHRLFLHIKE